MAKLAGTALFSFLRAFTLVWSAATFVLDGDQPTESASITRSLPAINGDDDYEDGPDPDNDNDNDGVDTPETDDTPYPVTHETPTPDSPTPTSATPDSDSS